MSSSDDIYLCPPGRRRFLPALPERLFARLVPLPGQCLAVYLILLQRSRIEGANPVVLTGACLDRFGLTRKHKSHALATLETAGLVRVERRGRHNPLVWLLKVENDP
jgi:DNA-binding transcriptional ArsR family regulator